MIALQKQLADANAFFGNPAQQLTTTANHISVFKVRNQLLRLLIILPLFARIRRLKNFMI
jgi:hypothetical protein